MSRRISLVYYIFVLVLIAPALSRAQSILITDCQGFTRVAQKVKANSLNNIEVQVSNSAQQATEQVQVTLTNSVTGQSVTASAQNGVAVFQNIAPGSFSVTSSAAGVSFASITVAPVALSTVAAVGVVTGGAVVGGGAATGIVIGTTEIVDQVQNKNSEPEPTPTPLPPTPTPQATPTPDCACDPNAEPEPIDDFFNKAVPTPSPLSPAA